EEHSPRTPNADFAPWHAKTTRTSDDNRPHAARSRSSFASRKGLRSGATTGHRGWLHLRRANHSRVSRFAFLVEYFSTRSFRGREPKRPDFTCRFGDGDDREEW